LGKDLNLKDLKREYDAVILTVGEVGPDFVREMDLKGTSRGLKVDRESFATSLPGVFAGGSTVSPSRMAVRAAAHGKDLAVEVNSFLCREERGERESSFNSRTGRLNEKEFLEMLKEAEDSPRVSPAGGFETGFTTGEADAEAARCFGCDCRKMDSCRLREYAGFFHAESRRISNVERGAVEKILQHESVIYQPGKCIRCGLCVRITARSGEKYGLAFVGRGYGLRVESPFSEPLSSGISGTAEECVKACPTAALSWLNRNKANIDCPCDNNDKEKKNL
jgi:ferredoxin